MNAPDIVRGDFIYHDALFANVGEMKRHPRASVAELKTYLLPKKNSLPKNQVAHWYEAQLLHYGLPRSKEKNTAKMRLVQAIDQGPLAVPPNILSLESEMKREYAAACRKAKAALKAQEAPSASQSAPKGKKREQDEIETAASTMTKVKVTVGNMTFDIEQQSASAQGPSVPTKKPPTKKQKQVDDHAVPIFDVTAKVKPTPKKASGKDAPTPAQRASIKTSAKENAPPKEKTSTKEKVPAEEKAPPKEKAPAKEKTLAKEKAPPKTASSRSQAPVKKEAA